MTGNDITEVESHAGDDYLLQNHTGNLGLMRPYRVEEEMEVTATHHFSGEGVILP